MGGIALPGSLRLCSGCCHFLADQWEAGHPSPCARVRWEGCYHRTPRLTMGGDGAVVCSDFLSLLDPMTDAIDAVIDVETFNHEIDQEKQDAASLETTRRRVQTRRTEHEHHKPARALRPAIQD